LSQAFRYGIYSNDYIEEAQGSLERDDEVILKCELYLNIAFLLILVGCKSISKSV